MTAQVWYDATGVWWVGHCGSAIAHLNATTRPDEERRNCCQRIDDVLGPVFRMIALERQRQNDKWGRKWNEFPDSGTALAILVEEVGEVARALLEHDYPHAMAEMVQVAAVAIAWIQARGNEVL